MFGLFTIIGYVAEGLLGTPLLYWFRRRGYSSLRSFLLGGVAIAIVVWLSTSLLYIQILREMSVVFNLMFLLVRCIAPVLLSTIVFWFIGGRQITRAWSGLAESGLNS
jgi:ABC-type thiamin/hydroxymethylpyrimidine transport system permease subunit